MDGSQIGADLLKAVVSSKSNTTRDATGSGSRDREHGALSLFELSLHAQPHTQRLDLEFLLGLSGYQKVSLSPSFCPVATLLGLPQNRCEVGEKVRWQRDRLRSPQTTP